jgi:membrane protein implicated in regulation of membrane protease activity
MLEFMGMSLYLLVAIVAGVLLMVLAFFGADFGGDGAEFDMGDGAAGIDHFDAGHGDFSGAHLSPLSLPLVLSFLTAFGALGALFEGMGFNVYLTPAISAGISIVIAGIMFWVMDTVFVQTQASSNVKTSKLMGMDGTITIPIKPGQQGQIMIITEARGRTLFAAVASEDIATDTAVVVDGFAGNALVVKRKKIGGT